jgi:CheY-like chemotaxis protein
MQGIDEVVGAGRMSEQRKILLVEDHHDTRRAMALLLRHYGFEVVEASTATEAIAKLDGQAIALLDVNLAGESGIDVFKHIQQQQHQTRVAFVTATNHPEVLNELTSLQVDAVFSKPVDFQKILNWVRAS